MLIAEEGLAVAFDRLSGVPRPLPQPIRRALDALPPDARHAFARRLIRTPTSPIGAAHAIRVLAVFGATDGRYLRAARRLARMLASRRSLEYVAPSVVGDDTIGTGDIANMLGVSPPTAQKLLDRGEVPSTLTPGGHRRSKRSDVLAWRERRDRQRQSLHALAQKAVAEERPASPLPPGVQGGPNVEDDA